MRHHSIASFARTGIVMALVGVVAAASPILAVNASNFNGTSIATGDVVWFTSVIHLSGSVPATPFSIYLTNSTISFTANSTNYNLATPNGTLTFLPAPTTPSTSFGSGAWTTTGVDNQSGNTFLAAYAFTVPTGGLPGGINPVTWTADFATNSTASITVNWQWAAAVYAGCAAMTGVTLNYNALGVQPADGSVHAGTPTNCESDDLGGARGGGAANWTGSLSGTTTLTPGTVPEPATWSLLVSALLAGLALMSLRPRWISFLRG